MQKTSCRHEQDRLDETRRLLTVPYPGAAVK
jgi:hypothetical protein